MSWPALGVIGLVALGACSGAASRPVGPAVRTPALPCPTRAATYVDYLTGAVVAEGSPPSPIPAEGADTSAPPGGVSRETAVASARARSSSDSVVSATLGQAGKLQSGGLAIAKPDRWIWVVVFAGHYGLMHQECLPTG